MNQIQQLAGRSASRIKIGLPWLLVLALSAGLAYLTNVGAARALSANRPFDAASANAGDAGNVCSLDVDGALYASTDMWQPAGRSAFCRAETYPGVPGRNDIAGQLAHESPLQATITFVAPTNIRIDLYCSTNLQQRWAEANFVSADEARHTYEQVCTAARSSG